MFARFTVLAVATTHAAGHPDDFPNLPREPAPVGHAFEHADGSIAIYLDALPVSGRMLLQPVDDLRSKPVRRGAIGGTDTARLRALEVAAQRVYDEREPNTPMSAEERSARETLSRLLP